MRRLAVLSLVLCAGLAAAACSLGLDESLIAGADAGVDAPVGVDAGADAAEAGPNPDKCTGDKDCLSANACLAGKCDVARGVCTYEVCPMGACQAAACTGSPMACGPAQPVKFRASQFKVAAGNVGCGGGGAGARRCIAAVHPFLFVGTTNGVVAYGMTDPTSAAPTAVPVGGVPFIPQHVVASGPRVYFVGPVSGSGPYKIAIASLLVPADPFTAKLTATAAFLSLAQSSVDTVFAGPQGGIFAVQQNALAAYPTGRAIAPIADLGALELFPSPGIPAGASIVSASEERLVTRRLVSNMGLPYQQLFSFENAAGTAGAQNGGEQNVAAAMGASPPEYFAQGPNGAIAWHGSGLVYPDGGGVNVQSTRVGWLVENGTATTFAAQPRVDVEPYSPPLGVGPDLAGPIAFLDADRLLVLSATATNLSQTAVQIVTKAPMPAVLPNRRFVLPFAPSTLAAAASGPYGYVLTPEPSLGAGPQVHVFAAGCDN